MKNRCIRCWMKKGRVLIPLEMRQKAEMEKGDIFKGFHKLREDCHIKVDILEVGKQDAEAVEAYVNAR